MLLMTTMTMITICTCINEYETAADDNHDYGDDVVQDETDDNNDYDPNNEEADKRMMHKEKKLNMNVCRWVQLIERYEHTPRMTPEITYSAQLRSMRCYNLVRPTYTCTYTLSCNSEVHVETITCTCMCLFSTCGHTALRTLLVYILLYNYILYTRYIYSPITLRTLKGCISFTILCPTQSPTVLYTIRGCNITCPFQSLVTLYTLLGYNFFSLLFAHFKVPSYSSYQRVIISLFCVRFKVPLQCFLLKAFSEILTK